MSRSGSVEPTWPTEEGARVTEYAGVPAPTTTEPPSLTGDGGSTLPGDTVDRYIDRRIVE